MTEIEWLDIFANNIRDMLDEKRMTQRDLAEMAELDESTISKYLKRERIPNMKALLNMSYALDCDLHELMDFGDMIR